MVDESRGIILAKGLITYVYVHDDKSKEIPKELIERINSQIKRFEDYF